MYLMSPLSDAYLRLDRGGEHLDKLNILHVSVCNEAAKRVVIKRRPNVRIEPGEAGVVADVDWGEPVEIPDRFGILAGDAANNFRSALDYLVGRLAELDTGVKKRRFTQFPIEDTPDGFTRRQPKYLSGLNGTHIRAIEQLQPYKGCDWAAHLRRLSNLDKHVELVIASHAFNVFASAKPKDSEDTTDARTSKIRMDMHFQPTLFVALGQDQFPIKETLKVIQLKVSEVLDAFKPEFQ